MKALFLVSIGGALGATLRYLISLWMKQTYTFEFPWHTLLINLSGCLCIGIAFALSVQLPNSDTIRLFVMIGILGGFTTFSSFGLETFQLIGSKAFLNAALYILVSNLGGILSVYLGYTMIQWMKA